MDKEYYQCKRCKKVVEETDLRNIVLQEGLIGSFPWVISVERILCKWCCEELKEQGGVKDE